MSKYIRGTVISDEKPKTVLEALEENWVLRGPGWPKRGFIHNNGEEFMNCITKEYMKKTGCSQRMTSAFSPWSNGSNERNHYSVDRRMMKLREEDLTLSLQEAVDLACFHSNQQIRKSGFSAHQLVFRNGSTIPGIMDVRKYLTPQ